MAGKVEVRNWTPTGLARDGGCKGWLLLREGIVGEDSRYDEGCGWCDRSFKILGRMFAHRGCLLPSTLALVNITKDASERALAY